MTILFNSHNKPSSLTVYAENPSFIRTAEDQRRRYVTGEAIQRIEETYSSWAYVKVKLMTSLTSD